MLRLGEICRENNHFSVLLMFVFQDIGGVNPDQSWGGFANGSRDK